MDVSVLSHEERELWRNKEPLHAEEVNIIQEAGSHPTFPAFPRRGLYSFQA